MRPLAWRRRLWWWWCQRGDGKINELRKDLKKRRVPRVRHKDQGAAVRFIQVFLMQIEHTEHAPFGNLLTKSRSAQQQLLQMLQTGQILVFSHSNRAFPGGDSVAILTHVRNRTLHIPLN